MAGLRNADGSGHSAARKEEEFLRSPCTWLGGVPTVEGAGAVMGTPPGTHAVQVVHDENDDRVVDRLPTEGLGLSKRASMRFGPLRWNDARFGLAEAGANVPSALRDLQ